MVIVRLLWVVATAVGHLAGELTPERPAADLRSGAAA